MAKILSSSRSKGLTLSHLLTTLEAFVESVHQDQTAQNGQSDI